MEQVLEKHPLDIYYEEQEKHTNLNKILSQYIELVITDKVKICIDTIKDDLGIDLEDYHNENVGKYNLEVKNRFLYITPLDEEEKQKWKTIGYLKNLKEENDKKFYSQISQAISIVLNSIYSEYWELI